ncbi:MAG TPA: RNA-directed DNA polymerase [Bacteroidia bacterium]|jgi:hypothetical protein|nr:RNA-directed DNA polymerase [Bacteroidia bacterium]HQF27036.1 RNA-directed DNA polymerase [Bacteroidia bacterium]HQK96816.1 RNA-directed DNA polymerase [Bacteroidia bacterium]
MRDIQLAVSIIKAFRERDCYMIELPSDLEVLYHSDLTFLDELEQSFENGSYSIQPCRLIEVPKERGMFRYYSVLDIKDQLYFCWLTIKCFPFIIKKIKPEIASPQSVLEEYPVDINWKKKLFRNNLEELEYVYQSLKPEHQFVFQSDITNFYTSVDHKILEKELIDCGVPANYATSLCKAMSAWAALTGRGLPQIFWASDILAEFYLFPFDNFLRHSNYSFARYIDNIEIFCHSKSDARKAYFEVVAFISKRGMYLKEEKTKFVSAQPIKNALAGKKTFKDKVKSTIKELPAGLSKYYYSIEEALGMVNCEERLLARPEAITGYLMHYRNNEINIDKSLASFLVSNRIEFSYQLYCALHFMIDYPAPIPKTISDSLHRIFNNLSQPLYVRCCAARLLLAENKNNHSLIKGAMESSDDNLFKNEMRVILERELPASRVFNP